MATSSFTEETSDLDWREVQAQLWLERSVKLRAELTRAQDVFSADQVKVMTAEEVAHHVLTLRKTLKIPTTVTKLVTDFVPVTFVPDPTYATFLIERSRIGSGKSKSISDQPIKSKTTVIENPDRDDDVFVLAQGVTDIMSNPKPIPTSSVDRLSMGSLADKPIDSKPPIDIDTESADPKPTAEVLSVHVNPSLPFNVSMPMQPSIQPTSTPVAAQPLGVNVTVQPVALAPQSSTDPMLLFAQMMAVMEKQRQEAEEKIEKRLKLEKDAERERLKLEKDAEREREERKEERQEKVRLAEIERQKEKDERQEKIRLAEIERQEKIRISEIERQERIRLDDLQRQDRIIAEQGAFRVQEQSRLQKIEEREAMKCQAHAESEKQLGSRLRKANDATRGSLYPMPTEPAAVATYLSQMDRIFDFCKVDEDLRSNLLTPFLTDRAREAVNGLSIEKYHNYSSWKEVILRQYRLTATAYRQQFLRASRSVGESCSLFVTRIRAMFKYYIASRKVQSLEDLIELILADRLRDSLHPNSKFMIQDKEQEEWMRVDDMAKTVDIYEVCRGYNLSEKEKKERSEKSSNVRAVTVAPKAGTSSESSLEAKRTEWRSRIRCYNCAGAGHLAKECKKPKQESSKGDNKQNSSGQRREPYCYFCNATGHSTKMCRRRPQHANPDSCWFCGNSTHKAKDCPKPRRNQDQKKVNRVDVVTTVSDELNVNRVSGCTSEYESSEMLLQKGKISLAGVISNFVCDSGTQISVINSKMLPHDYTRSHSSGKILNLKSAWGDIARAEVVNIPARIVQSVHIMDQNTEILICCAVTDKLLEDTALLTVEDVKALQEAVDCQIPQAELITGTHIYYTDPNYMQEQMVRRVEEKVLNRSGKTIGLPLFKPNELPDLRTTSRETEEEFRKSQKEDSTLALLWDTVGQEDSCFLVENDLLYRNKDLQGTTISQLVLPVAYRDQVIYAAHDALWSMHFGHKKTSKRIQLYFWWPALDSQVKTYVKSCPDCQSVARKTRLDRVPIAPVERGIQAFDVIHIDMIGPLPIKSTRGHQHVLTAVCSLTRWPMAVPVKTLTAKELCDALISLFTTCGIPRVIISDNGTNMVSGLTQEMYKRLGIELRTSSAYHPEGNAIVERFNQSLKRMLHHVMASDEPKNWDKQLPFLLWSYRELPNDTNGVSPHMMVYGQTPKGPLSVLKDRWSGSKALVDKVPVKVQEYLEILKKDLSLCHEVAKDHAKDLEVSYRHQYNKCAKEKSFQVGDQVLVLMPDNSHKLLSKWTGPGTVTAVLSNHSYRVALDTGAVKELHANHLRKWIARVNSLGVVFEDDEDFGKIEVYPTETSEFQEELQKVNLDHLDDRQAKEFRDMLAKHEKVFSNVPGHCNLLEHEINLVEGFKPKPLKQYRIPEKLRDEVDKQIDKLLADGKVQHSNSEYAHPIIAVSKPDGGVRLCTDLRMVNSGTINCAYPSVIPEDILMRVSSAPYITTLDCTSGYWQIPLREGDRHKTAFHSNRGLLEWVFMPFGLKTASATFQKAMDLMLSRHSTFALAYIDDIIIYSFQWEDHLSHCDTVLTTTGKAGMTIKLSKCQFAKQKVEYIGHLVGSGQRSVVAEKITPILSIPQPRNKKLLRSFLGMCSFYRAYIRDFAEISVPLTNLTRKGSPDKITFNQVEVKSFEGLKEALGKATTLYSPSSEKPFVIRTDASDYAVGAVLAQTNEDQEFPIAFASAKLTGAQLNWSTIEKEAYAIIYALQKFDYLIFGREIHLYTDHNPLQYLAISAPKSAKLTRWALSLSRYNIRVHHTAGVDNVTADCLSRCIE